MVDEDMSVVIVGITHGNFSGALHGGGYDMVAIKVDAATGAEIWRHQVRVAQADMQFLDGC